MDLEKFVQAYKNRLDLSSIPWEDFPEQLQEAGWRFMNNWKDELPLRHLRELSGFDDMSINDLVEYAKRRKNIWEESNT